ncbi:hypothetical protein GQ600_1420 [Phytophthora cactorum]|nr:hypothetical protein GQ600_1420 [Phytophthora cactorum]
MPYYILHDGRHYNVYLCRAVARNTPPFRTRSHKRRSRNDSEDSAYSDDTESGSEEEAAAHEARSRRTDVEAASCQWARSSHESCSGDRCRRTVFVAIPNLRGGKFDTWEAFVSAFSAENPPGKYVPLCNTTVEFDVSTLIRLLSSTHRLSEKLGQQIKAKYAEKEMAAPYAAFFLDESFPHCIISCEHANGGDHRSRGTVHSHRLGREEFAQLPKTECGWMEMEAYTWNNTDCESNLIVVHNLPAKVKRVEEAGTSLSERVSETLDRFCENDPFAVSHVDMERQGDKSEFIARYTTLQTSHMRSRFSAVSEVLLVDATHDTNFSRYKLFILWFMMHLDMANMCIYDTVLCTATCMIFNALWRIVPDCGGLYQLLCDIVLLVADCLAYCWHALISDERASTLRHAMKQFKMCNPSW